MPQYANEGLFHMTFKVCFDFSLYNVLLWFINDENHFKEQFSAIVVFGCNGFGNLTCVTCRGHVGTVHWFIFCSGYYLRKVPANLTVVFNITVTTRVATINITFAH